MTILLLTIGSAGDVHPFIGIAQALQRRGHRVRMIVNPHFTTPIQNAGLELIPLGKASDYEDLLADPNLWHRRKGLRAILNAVAGGLETVYETLMQNYVAGETVIAASSLAFGARIAQDQFHLPMATVHLSPAIFRSAIAPPKLPGVSMPAWLPRSWKAAMFAVGDRAVIYRLIGPPINRLRAKHGLPPVRRIMSDWWHSPRRVIGLFPSWFAAPQPDWPPQTRLTGFPLYDQRDLSAAPPQLSEFFSAGPPPIVFTPGSAMHHAHRFFRTSVEACRRLNRRAVLLTRHVEQIPPDLPPTIRHFPYVPFSHIFPRAAVIVHHGGIGTSAQAMSAGVPQIVCPFTFDQLDNADRMQRLGIARTIHPNRYRPGQLMAVLEQLHSDPIAAEAARQVAQRFVGQNWIEQTCDLIEELKPG